MEEKSKMEVVKEDKPKVRKLSYEELENAANQLSEQSRQLYIQNQKLTQALEEANISNFYERLEWLWKVITTEVQYLSDSFKEECGKEFMLLMTKPKEEEIKEESKQNK